MSSLVREESGQGAEPGEDDSPFANRTFIQSQEDGFRSDGALILPQTFGSIHLGECFSAFISLGNQSPVSVANIHIKVVDGYCWMLWGQSRRGPGRGGLDPAGCGVSLRQVDLQIERYKHSLYDNSSKILESLEPNAQHYVIGTHDLKDLGQHTLVCTATYQEIQGDRRGEKKHLNQFFKFNVTNPVSVKTKVPRVVDISLWFLFFF